MKLHVQLLAFVASSVTLSPAPKEPAALARPARPNIVILLADDLGYADVGVHGYTDVPTPHIDSIANEGVRFTDGYATQSVCAPSRAGLLSGLYSQRFGFEHNPGSIESAADNFGLPRKVATIAEKLKSVGYATGMVGKWHVGYAPGLRPHERGFDFSFGFLGGAHPYNASTRRRELLRNGKTVKRESEYLTDAFARESVTFIEEHKDEPFFLLLAFNAVHTPMQPPEGSQEQLAHIANPTRRALAGMHASMDNAIGRILAKLDELGLDENTLVFFYSDNGGIPAKNGSRNDPLSGAKGDVLEGGIRIPFMVRWTGTLPAGTTYEKPVMGFDVHATALAAAGYQAPDEKVIDGVDLVPYLTGKRTGEPHDTLYWRDGSQHAVRRGDWKLVVLDAEPARLFNLRDDIGETTDLAAAQPARLEELKLAFEQWGAGMMQPLWTRKDEDTKKPNRKRRGRD